MLLAINIQNSAITLGCFDRKGKLCVVSHIASEARQTADQYACQIDSVLRLHGCEPSHIYGAIICSVVPALSGVLREAAEILCHCEVVNVSSGVKTGLSIRMDNPRVVGSDLVCVAVEAAAKKRLPALVIDMNTAVTFTALDETGALVGSIIAPGMRIGLESLHTKAAQLPSIGLARPHTGLLGKNTMDAMASGVLNGTACMIDGMVGRCKQQLGENLTVYLTGTDAELVAPYVTQSVHRADNMVLYGLHRIWMRNKRREI